MVLKPFIKYYKKMNMNENLTIVVVDDSKMIRNLLVKIVKDLPLTLIAEGSDGNQAIELAQKHKPDFMTLDITMPNSNGLTALEEIQKTSPDTQVVIISALSAQHTIVEALSIGAVDYLAKPFQSEDLVRVLQNCIDNLKSAT